MANKTNVKPENEDEVVNKTTEPEVTEPEVKSKVVVEKAKPVIKREPRKKMIVIPIDPLNPQDTYVEACLDGKNYQIKRGVEVEVPERLARLLKEGHYLGY